MKFLHERPLPQRDPQRSTAQLLASVIGALTAALILSPADGQAAILFSENFDAAQPVSASTTASPGAGFQVSSGDVDIIGNVTGDATAGFSSCPHSANPANNCLDLNGNRPGAITSTAGFNLAAGNTYALSFSLGGSVPLGKPYTMQATIGNSAPFTFSVPGGNDNFGTEVINYTPAVTQTNAHIAFASTTNIPGNAQYGALIDSVTLSSGVLRPAPNVLFAQDFSAALPGPTQAGAIAGTGFTVTSGNVDVFGAVPGKPSFYSCPSPLTPGQPCIDMNGTQPARIVSDRTFDLAAGGTYTVQFQMAGNIPNGGLADYTLEGSFGDSGAYTFSALPGSAFQTETFSYTPTTDQTGAQLEFWSGQTLDSLLYGPIISDIVLTGTPGVIVTSSAPSSLPEPATLLVLLTAAVSLTLLSAHATDPDQ